MSEIQRLPTAHLNGASVPTSAPSTAPSSVPSTTSNNSPSVTNVTTATSSVNHTDTLNGKINGGETMNQSANDLSNPPHPNTKTTTHVNNGTTTTKTSISSPVCHNCKTQTTPLWRRDETGQVLCNACGLFLKLHGRPRPSSLKTDTIKSRNRVKQNSGNSTKSSTPNTPKLESKDSNSNLKIYNTITSSNPTTTNNSNNMMKKSPKVNKKIENLAAGPKNQAVQQHLYGQQFNNPGLPNYNHHLQNHISHPVQPLHYPSSTPTSFAPGLQRITSPLLLSNTSSISNTRSSNTSALATAASSIHQAAGALENMSNELGPSATFQKNSKITTPVSLINNNKVQIKREPSPIFSTPSSALNYAKPLTPNSKSINSPSFGPQYHLQSQASLNGNSTSSTPKQVEVLPPIQQVASLNKPSLPHIANLTPVENDTSGDNNDSNTNNNNNNNNTNNQDHQSSQSNTGNSGDDKKKDDEITILKTRISELELVNDLYRTRIMELEAMEQAARLRENSMRRRLDEIINLQEGNDLKRPKLE